jgi:hypothetical protein
LGFVQPGGLVPVGLPAAGAGPHGSHPEGQLSGGQKVEGAARPVGFDQAAALPQGDAHAGLLDPADPGSHGQLRRTQHLGLDSAHQPHGGGELVLRGGGKQVTSV